MYPKINKRIFRNQLNSLRTLHRGYGYHFFSFVGGSRWGWECSAQGKDRYRDMVHHINMTFFFSRHLKKYLTSLISKVSLTLKKNTAAIRPVCA